MIAPPSIEEIRCAFNDAQVLYPPIQEYNPKMLLVPHAGIHESRIVTAATLLYLSKQSKNIILLGTNHAGTRFSNDFEIINSTVEHSLTINQAFLNYLNQSCTMMLLDPAANFDAVALSLTDWLKQDPNNILIVSSDLSHYHSNQEQDNVNESPLIQSLIDTNSIGTDESLKYVNACGDLVLKVAVRIAHNLNWSGVVTCYNDSNDKRLGWSTLNGPTVVSYLGMIWIPNNMNIISSFDQQQLVVYAKSCVGAVLRSASIPEMPSWSIWYKYINGVFVGIKNRDGQTQASIGRYQESNRTIIDNVRDSAIGTVDDARNRWKQPLNINDINNYVFYVNILENESDWKTYRPIDLIGHISPADNYGFYLIINSKMIATFLPSVWSDLTPITFEELMTQLTIKAGGNGNEWQSPTSIVKLYQTSYIEYNDYSSC